MKIETIKFEDQALIGLKQLPKNRIRQVIDFIEYLKAKEEWEATKEILSDKEFIASIRRGEEDIKARRYKKWQEVREDA